MWLGIFIAWVCTFIVLCQSKRKFWRNLGNVLALAFALVCVVYGLHLI